MLMLLDGMNSVDDEIDRKTIRKEPTGPLGGRFRSRGPNQNRFV
jgi:hypothetical protein